MLFIITRVRPDIYGKISVSWYGGTTHLNVATSPGRRLREHLDPLGTGVMILDGACFGAVVNVTGEINPGRPPINAVCDVNIQDATITNGATLIINAVGNIYVENVNLINNSRLILDAGGRVRLGAGFRVEQGSSFSIR